MGRVDGDIHPTQTGFHQLFGFFFGDECAVGGHGHFDTERRCQFHKIGDVRAQHWFAAGNVNFLRAHLCQLGDDFF